MKRDGRKIVGIVAWDYQIAQIIDRAGVEIISVGDTVAVNLWACPAPLEVPLEEMLVVCKAVRRGTKRALVSCDFPFGPLQEGTDSAVKAAIRLVKEAGADIIKLDGAADFPDAVRAIARAGIPVFAQFGITPQTALAYGMQYSAMNKPGAELAADMAAKMVDEAKRLEDAGASLLDFTNSGAVAGVAVVRVDSGPEIAGGGAAPKFTYDGSWPKLPLPNKWTFEGITGLAVDKDDVIWVLNRPGDFDIDPIFRVPEKTENYAALNPPTALCCLKPEGILAFDMQGNLLRHWNQSDKIDGHLILADKAGNIWIGSDTMRKYTEDRKLLGAIERVFESQTKPGAL